MVAMQQQPSFKASTFHKLTKTSVCPFASCRGPSVALHLHALYAL